MSTQSRAETGLGQKTLWASPPPLIARSPTPEPDFSTSLQPASTGTHPLTPTPAGFAAHSWRKTSHASTATATAAAGGVYHTPNGATEDVRVVSKATLADGAVPITTAAPIGEVCARMATVGDAATAFDYNSVSRATPDVTCDIFTEAVADGYPPLGRNIDLNPEGGPDARRDIKAISPAQLPLPRPSRATSAGTLEGRISGSA